MRQVYPARGRCPECGNREYLLKSGVMAHHWRKTKDIWPPQERAGIWTVDCVGTGQPAMVGSVIVRVKP